MNQQESIKLINEALSRALKRRAEVGPETDLLNEMDSLESMVFFLELEELSGKKFPDTDLVKEGFYKVDKLVQYLNGGA
jgi:acyl carrier protein